MKKMKRTKRVKNGTVTWKVTTSNTNTKKITIRKVRKTYDEVTMMVNRIRNRNPYNEVVAEEMDKKGKMVLPEGRIVSLDSLEDERMFEEAASRALENDDEDNDYAEGM